MIDLLTIIWVGIFVFREIQNIRPRLYPHLFPQSDSNRISLTRYTLIRKQWLKSAKKWQILDILECIGLNKYYNMQNLLSTVRYFELYLQSGISVHLVFLKFLKSP